MKQLEVMALRRIVTEIQEDIMSFVGFLNSLIAEFEKKG